MLQKIIKISAWFLGFLVIFVPSVAMAAGSVVAPNPLGGVDGVDSLFGENGLIFRLLEWAIIIAGVVAVIYIIVGGYQYMTGGEDGVKTGRGTVTAAIVGLVIVLIAYILVNTIHQTLNAKENFRIGGEVGSDSNLGQGTFGQPAAGSTSGGLPEIIPQEVIPQSPSSSGGGLLDYLDGWDF